MIGGRRWGRARSAAMAVVAAFAVATATMVGAIQPAAAASAIETTYAAPGPYGMTTTTATNPAGTRFNIFYPTQLATLPFSSPIITWGNGSGSNTDKYDNDLLRHLVSWGFTVVAFSHVNTGSGREILAGAQYLVAQNSTVGSPFYQRLDPDKVAAVGHSQGAGGATRAATAVPGGPGLIKTVLAYSLPWNGEYRQPGVPPGTGWVGANDNCPTANDCMYYPATLTQPVFFVGTHGSSDAVIGSPDVQRFYYNAVPGQAVLGLIQNSRYETVVNGVPTIRNKAADHSSIQDSSSSGNPLDMLGYSTAWLMYQLRGDTYAAGAFTGANPEIVTNANWPGSAAKP